MREMTAWSLIYALAVLVLVLLDLMHPLGAFASFIVAGVWASVMWNTDPEKQPSGVQTESPP